MRAILSGGLFDPDALRGDYLDELLKVGRRPGYPIVARAVYRSFGSLASACSRYSRVGAPVHVVCAEKGLVQGVGPGGQPSAVPAAAFTLVLQAGHFIALEWPDVPDDLLNAAG